MFKTIGIQKLVAAIVPTVLFMSLWIFGNDFAKYDTLVSIFDLSYCVGFTAVGITFVIITEGINLSIGTVCIYCSLISRTLYTKLGLPTPLCAILVIPMGDLLGLASGPVISAMRLPTFIATLGTMMITKGLGPTVANTVTVTFPQAFAPGGSFGGIFKLKRVGLPQADIPTGSMLLTTLAILMAILLNKARPRRYILSLGSSKEATRLSGIDAVKWETLAYITNDLFTGLAGVSYAAVYSTPMPGTGDGFEPDTIAGIVIDGTSLAGGVGSIPGVLIGAFIMSILKTGLPFMEVQPHYQLLITGFVLIITVFVNVSNRGKQEKS